MNDDMNRIADELAVRNVISRIARLADQGDLDEYVDQFTEDALWNFPPGPRKGRADILAGARERRASGTTGPGSGARHHITTVEVNVGDDGTATADSYLSFIVNTANGPSVAVSGSYHDTFVRQGSRWRLARRDIDND
jgi:3-phenylpropionate/cinnamic acid dioxygenase small subunit